ncbi:hypothetical protein BVY04_01080, partial [bacterium M21]
MKLRSYITLIATIALFSCTFAQEKERKDGIYAEMETTKGTITLQLFHKKTPLTVTNFIALSEGKMTTNKRIGKPFFDGLTFHRVIANFMIQGGCPEGTGNGGPGYAFPDEFDPSLRHGKAGILSMANAGPGTNGSQFFITHGPTPHLNDKHTVFGEVISGLDIVNKIAIGDSIKTLKIVRVGEEAEAFKADQAAFDALQKGFLEKLAVKAKAVLAEQEKLVSEKYANATKTDSGLMFIIDKPAADDAVKPK